MKKTETAACKPAARIRDTSSVERLYYELRDRAMRYEFRPGTRINEQALGREFGVSRAPLREALNRLVAEGLLTFVLNKGFFRKGISVDEVLDLYQVRVALERRAVFLALRRASAAEIQAVHDYWASVMGQMDDLTAAQIVLADEEFHRRLVALAKNREIDAFLEVVTRRIHVARNVDVEQSEANAKAYQDHFDVLDSLQAGNREKALDCITEHIDMSLSRALRITREMEAMFGLEASGSREG